MAAGRKKGDGRGRLGGRQKGTPNKVGRELREELSNVIERYINGDGIGTGKNTLETDLSNMAPEDRARVASALVPYVIPKLSSVEIKDKSKTKSFKDELDELEHST